MFLNWLSGALVGVGGSDFIGKGSQCVGQRSQAAGHFGQTAGLPTGRSKLAVHTQRAIRIRIRIDISFSISISISTSISIRVSVSISISISNVGLPTFAPAGTSAITPGPGAYIGGKAAGRLNNY